MKLFASWRELLFTAIGGIIGSTITYFVTVDIEERKLTFDERRKGYVQFFEATAKGWEVEKLEKQRDELRTSGDGAEADTVEARIKSLKQEHSALYDKTRFAIGVFSDGEVVRKVAEYQGRYFEKKSCANNEKFRDDVAIYQAMRSEVRAGGSVSDEDLALVLFGCKL